MIILKGEKKETITEDFEDAVYLLSSKRLWVDMKTGDFI